MNNLQAEPQYGGSTNQPGKGKGKLLTSKQVGVMLDVATTTVVGWHLKGKLKHAAVVPGRGGDHYLFAESDVREFESKNTIRRLYGARNTKARGNGKAKPAPIKLPKISDTMGGRIEKLVRKLNTAGSPLQATVETVRNAALNIGLEALERKYVK